MAAYAKHFKMLQQMQWHIAGLCDFGKQWTFGEAMPTNGKQVKCAGIQQII